MSKAHELTLLGKWSEAVLPPLSPTSPKATKFCCCPNRRRYNIKQPKAKSTLDARNIFLDSEFSYIVTSEDNDEPTTASTIDATGNSNTSKSSTRNGARKAYKKFDKENTEKFQIKAYESSKEQENNSDYENYDDAEASSSSSSTQPMNCEGTEQKCDKEKKSEHSNNNQEIKISKNSKNNSFVTKQACDNENDAAASSQQTTTTTATATTINRHDTNKCHNNFRSEQQQQQQQNTIQRLSNSETNNCNNHKEIQNIHQNDNNDISNDDHDEEDCHCCHYDDNTSQQQQQYYQQQLASVPNNKPDNYCQRRRDATVECNNTNNSNNNGQDVVDSGKIDLPNTTMTITTTTNVANRKNSTECGLTTTTTTATTTTTTTTITTPKSTSSSSSAATMQAESQTPTSPTTTSPSPPPRPFSPSLTTVIKTTMVKRSPANESKSAPTTPTTPPLSGFNIAMASLHNGNEPSIASQATSNGAFSSYVPSKPNDRVSVKERIAALVAGSEQIKLHDNSIRTTTTPNQCNKNQSNMTIATRTTQKQQNNSNVQSAINSLQHHKRQSATAATKTTAVISADRNDSKSSNCTNNSTNNSSSKTSNVAVITTPATESSSSSSSSTLPTTQAQAETLISINDIPPRHKSGLNDAQRVSFALPSTTTAKTTMTTSTTPSTSDALVQAALLAGNTGCATLLRRRSPASTAGMCERSILKHGSNTGANMTSYDKNFATALMQTPTASSTSSSAALASSAHSTPESTSSSSACRNLAALDNLDLALSIDLNDDDGEDPYYALQEYLERVKHEINEVFELHKARQRMQQQQEQEQEHDTAPASNTTTSATMATTTTSATTTTASNDELSRSTESDSGFDSASGGHYQSNSNNTNGSSNNHNNSSQLQISADGVPAAAATEISCPNDINGHASFVKSTTTTTNPTLLESLNNKQKQSQQQIANRKTTTSTSTIAASTTTTPTPTTSIADQQTNRRFTKLKALPPPPTTATNSNNKHYDDNDGGAAEDVNIWANKFLRDLDNLMAAGDKPTAISSSSVASSPTSTTSPMLLSAAAKAAIQSRYGKAANAATTLALASSPPVDQQQRELPTTTTTSDAAASSIVLVRPEKHATIPLQSFNLDCGRLDAGTATKSNIAYMRTLSAPTPYQQQQYQLQQQHDNKLAGLASGKNNRNSLATFNATNDAQQQHQHQQNLTNFQSKNAAEAAATETTTTLLKIEETAGNAATSGRTRAATAKTDAQDIIVGNDEESLKRRRQRQLENDMETIRNSLAAIETLGFNTSNSSSNNSSDKGMAVASSTTTTTNSMATSIPKRERINHATVQTSLLTTTPNGQSSGGSSSKPLVTATSSSSSSSSASSASSSSAALALTSSPATSTKANAAGYLLNGSEATKKGSTSTIWTSEESILRSVGAVDEDNNSTSSSACEEASGVLSSGKSGISLDSSGLDNENNESGIGTATPPKDLAYWKSIRHNDNESMSSLDALRKTKFQKSSSVASSDDPDLLEVLSLCDEPSNGGNTNDEDIDESHDDIDDRHKTKMHHQQQQQQQKQHKKLTTSTPQQQRRLGRHNHHKQENKTNDSLSGQAAVEAIEATEESIMLDETTPTTAASTLHADEDDEGHDEFETVPYCDCDFTDGDMSSASGGSAPNGSPITMHDIGGGVVLRRKYSATPIMVPFSSAGGGRRQKNRSHSLDTSSLPSAMGYHSPHSQLHAHQLHHHLHHHVGQSQLSRKLHHLQNRSKERGKLSLALRQEPFQSLLAPAHFHELPSPSSASLHSGHECIGIQELTTKSNSAPLLLKQEKQKREDFVGQKLSLRYSRSQSDRYLAEIEAVEACKWLRAAGFPQYAQMYEDHQFPIDLPNVAKDHTNLENDQLQSLYRRLSTLNRCATMRLDQSHKPQTPQKEDSDDENFALSENWTFQPHIRRWSRIGEGGLELPPAGKLQNAEKTESSSKESSPDRFEDDNYDVSGAMLSLTLPSGSDAAATQEAADEAAVRLRRTGSERLKDGAKALLRRVESIKSRRRKRQNRDGIVISGPQAQAFDLSQLGQRGSLRKPDAVYSTPPSPSAVSPMHTFPAKSSPFYGNELKVPSSSEHFLSPNRASPKRTPTTPRSMRASPLHFFSNAMPHLREGKSDDSSSYYSDSQESSTGGKITLRKPTSKTRRFLQRSGKVDDIGAHSDSECHHGRKLLIKDANSNTTEVKVKKLTRGGSLNLGRDSKKRDGFRSASFRSRSTSRKEGKPDESDSIKNRSPVVRWHSFQMEERPHMIFRKCFAQKFDPQQQDNGTPFAAMSAGQLQIIRKLALVILTGHMERYCPTHRSGWNWELPKFIKKMKLPPDYKDKRVFGVPLLLVLQRTGQTLPTAVRAAFRWLQLNALDQIGLFRKSGVKSRILRLKELIEYSETTGECMEVYDTQQAYDVADMLKQYFRDLPESLLTTKMSETFVAIFQHLPPEVRLDAIQCAVLLLPDENREILFALLEFLTLVAANAKYNQMTANNLAVCLAPSLFHNNITTGAGSVSASPRRRNKAGMPDNKELSEAKASHECLAFMIENYKQIFTASKEKIHKCNFGYMEESKPVPLEALGEGMQFHNWRGYLYECTSATIKEGREKTRGWFTVTQQTDPNVEVAYKKVGDGHPLRLWRCITDIEGPPKEVLAYIIKQRASWDPNLLQCQTVKKLDDRTEIYQYAIDGQVTTDFCVLRSWQTDLPRGACVIVETSIDHAKAKPLFGAVRGVVLASRYLIEPCGSGKSRVMHLARVDIKGRTPEWYNKCFGHLCSHYLAKIRSDFKNITEGPESKV